MTLLRKTNSGYPTFSNLLEDIFSTVDVNNSFRSEKSIPAVNIAENNDGFRIEFAAAGLSKKDFKINLDNNVLTVSSEKEMENNELNQTYTRREFNYSSFQRSFTLPDSANGDEIKAGYNEGVLTIEIPKREEAKIKPIREIEIK